MSDLERATELLRMVADFDDAVEVGRSEGPLPNSLRRAINQWLALRRAVTASTETGGTPE